MGRGSLGFGRNFGETLRTSLPELPMQLRDLRNNQKFSKTNIVFSIKNTKVIFLDLDLGFQTFGAGSGEEILRRIRI